jgi:transposase
MPHKLPDQKLQQLVACIDGGLSCREAAARIGVSVATAIRWTQKSGRKSYRSFRLSPDMRAELLAALRNGASPKDAAARFGVPLATAARLHPRSVSNAEKAQRREALFAALRRGLSRRQAASETGLSVATAIRWARDADIAPLPPRRRPGPEVAAEVRAALRDGMTRDQATRTFDLHRSTVARLAGATRGDSARAAKRERLFAALRSGLSRRKAAVVAGLPVATAIRWARGVDLGG